MALARSSEARGSPTRRPPSIQKSKPWCTVTSKGASAIEQVLQARTGGRLGAAAPACRARRRARGAGVGDVAARVAARWRLHAHEHRAVGAGQRGPGHGQDGRDGDLSPAPRAARGEGHERGGRGTISRSATQSDLPRRAPRRAGRTSSWAACAAARRGRPCSDGRSRTDRVHAHRPRGPGRRRTESGRRTRFLLLLGHGDEPTHECARPTRCATTMPPSSTPRPVPVSRRSRGAPRLHCRELSRDGAAACGVVQEGGPAR